jgi:type IV pilus biogenesis protein CpaD/CtpE
MSKIAVSVMAGVVLFTQIASACGDKLVAVGSGVRMDRIVRSAHPGTVIVLASNPANRAAETELVAGLIKTGHKARLITDPAELQGAVAEHAPDVVLADADNLQATISRFSAGGAKAPAVVLVLVRPSRNELSAARKTSACVAELPDWGVTPVLQYVNNIRASQDSGRSVQCSERPRSDT